MSKAATRKPPTSVLEESRLPTEERIRLRAYTLFEARGREDGHQMEDWLEAESELNASEAEAEAETPAA